jgi:acetoacetyl-CoA synthetase
VLTDFLQAVDESIPIDKFPRFFEGLRLNFAENVLCRGNDGVAIIGINEDNLTAPDVLTWDDLRMLVADHAGAMRASGLRKGDVVACETVTDIVSSVDV